MDLGAADVVVVGPAPPLRGGIAAHSARLVEHLRGHGVAAVALSYRRLYPSMLFPGRAQRGAGPRPPWCEEGLDGWSPASGLRMGKVLERGTATVVVQWWHPAVAPALLPLLGRVGPGRLVGVCHNVRPHERFPAAGMLTRAVLGRCGRVVCHSASEAGRVGALLGGRADVVTAALPALVSADDLRAGARKPPAGIRRPDGPLFVAAGHLRAYKGTALLIEAWRSARRPAGAVLALVGESYLGAVARFRVQQRIADDPSILMVDRYVDDVELVSWLSSADAVVAPYLEASQSGMLALAAALGVPTVVSDAGGLPEQAGPDGIVFAAGDAAALTVALERRFAQSHSGGSAARTAKSDGAADAGSRGWQRVVEAMGVAVRPSAA